MCTRQVKLYLDILGISAPTAQNCLANLQNQNLQKSKLVYICYMCEPSSKKAEKQHESGTVLDYPSNFLLKTLHYFEDEKDITIDRLQLLKGVLCLMGEVHCEDMKVRHVLRSKNKPVLEYYIFVMRKIFESGEQNVKKFRTEHHFCVFEIKILCKWHLLGCPHSLPQQNENRLFRKSWDKPLGIFFRKLNPEIEANMILRHRQIVARDLACAGCQWSEEIASNYVAGTRYADKFLYTLSEIESLIRHHKERRKHNVRLCYACKRISVVSFTQYLKICSNFPLEYQEHNLIQYYDNLLRV